MSRLEKIEDIIKLVLAEQFPNADTYQVLVKEDCDDDGERIYDVRVIMESTKTFDAEKAVSLPRLIMNKLDRDEEFAFPVMSYISKAELERARGVAA